MAHRRVTTPYHTYGSVAYAPAYDGSAVRAPRREEELEQQPIPRSREREQIRSREYARTKVQVREAGQVAPFAVVGFLVAAVFAMLVLVSFAQYAQVTDEVVSLRQQMTELESDYATLSAQYERIFDIAAIQEAVGDEMVRPTGDQVVYIDLSQPDTVTVYGEDAGSLVERALDSVWEALTGVVDYFR